MTDFLNYITNSPFFGICLSLFFYQIALFIHQKIKSDFTNPLLLTVIFVCSFLHFSGISLEDYQKGASYISLLLGPSTVALGLFVYQQKNKLREYFWPIVLASSIGSLVSMVSVGTISYWLGLDRLSTRSLLVKSVTSPIAVELSKNLGGNLSLTVVSVVLTGIFGAVMAPFFIKILRLSDKVAIGLSIGVSSHALGTSKAIFIGEVEGAMSSVAISISGLFTVLWVSLFLMFA